LNGIYLFLQNNAVYLVTAVVLVLWAEIFLYIMNVDKRIKRFEEKPDYKIQSKSNSFFTLTVITIFIGAVLYYLSTGIMFFENDFSKIKQSIGIIEVMGTLQPQSASNENNETKFIISDSDDVELNVIFKGDIVNQISVAKKIALKGTYKNGSYYAADFLIVKNSIYTVMIIVLIVWAGIFFYILSLDKRIKNVQQELNNGVQNEK